MVSEPSDAARLEVSLIFLDPYVWIYVFFRTSSSWFFLLLLELDEGLLRTSFFSLSFLIPLFFFTQ